MTSQTVETNKLKLYVGVEPSMGTRPSKVRLVEVNKYNKYGQSVEVTSRKFIGGDRMANEGTVTGRKHMVGWTQDLTQHNIFHFLPAVLWSACVETTRTNPIFGTAIPITSQSLESGTNNGIFGASGGGLDAFSVNDLVVVSGMPTASNNGLTRLSAVSSTSITTTTTMVDDAVTSSTGVQLKKVGKLFASGKVSVEYTAGNDYGRLKYTGSTSGDAQTFQNAGIPVGVQIIMDANGSANRFVNNRGRIRVKGFDSSGNNSYLIFDNSDFTPANEAGTGISLHLYWGNFGKNETGNNIVDRTLTTLQVLPQVNGDEHDYKYGIGVNEVKIAIPKTGGSDAKVTLDITGDAMKSDLYNATSTKPTITMLTGDSFEACYNSASELISRRLYKCDNRGTPNATGTTAHMEEVSLNFKNNVKILNEIGTPDGFEVSKGMIDFTGDFKAYYPVTASSMIETSIANKEMYGAYFHFSRLVDTNSAEGIFFDIPRLQLKTDGKDAQEDGVVMIPLTFEGVRDKDLNTLFGITFFDYIPSAYYTTIGVA